MPKIFLAVFFCRLGDLLCCETCPAVYHLACVNPPLAAVPEDDWHCVVCLKSRVSTNLVNPPVLAELAPFIIYRSRSSCAAGDRCERLPTTV